MGFEENVRELMAEFEAKRLDPSEKGVPRTKWVALGEGVSISDTPTGRFDAVLSVLRHVLVLYGEEKDLNICPDCGENLEGKNLKMHRLSKHGVGPAKD